jgi:hypothetical protein
MELTRDDFPEDIRRLRELDIDLPEAVGHSESTCPVPIEELFTHLTNRCSSSGCEAGKLHAEYNLRFVRTAEMNETVYWIWFFTDGEGVESFVLVGSGRKKSLEHDETIGMTAEQIIVAHHFDIE